MFDPSQPINIWNEDCLVGATRHLPDGCVDLGIHDPPFNIGEDEFDKHYKREKDEILDGYVEAPKNIPYVEWSYGWLKEAARVLKADGSLYVFSGHSYLLDVMLAARQAGLVTINHVIWRYNFGVYTQKKYVTAHYHILYLKKSESAQPHFDPCARFAAKDRDVDGSSLQYADMLDVWDINKEFQPGAKRNRNKLPEEVVRKILLYSSRPGDLVCDFFMGNFTTAMVARSLARLVCGFELNPKSFHHHLPLVQTVPLEALTPVAAPETQQGDPLTDDTIAAICRRFQEIYDQPYQSSEREYLLADLVRRIDRSKVSKKDAINQVAREFGRGYFGIYNVLQKHMSKPEAP